MASNTLTRKLSDIFAHNYRLRNVSIAFSSDEIASRWVWSPVLARLTSLTFEECPITERDFVRILSHCIYNVECSNSPCNDVSNLNPESKLENDYTSKSSNLR